MNQPTKQEASAVSKDIRENISRLQSFLDRVIQHSSNGTIHPELYESDCDTLRESIQRLKEFRRYIESLPEQGEAVGEVVLESMGIGDAQIVRFHMYKEIPPIGTKLYTRPQPAIPPGYAVVRVEPNKAALIGEFSFPIEHVCDQCPVEGDCEVCDGSGLYLEQKVVPWTTIKEIIAAHIASSPAIQPAPDVEHVEGICEAYESGYGHGLKRDGLDGSRTPFADPMQQAAYQYGYECGAEKAGRQTAAPSVPVAKNDNQVSKDAARYRWLRNQAQYAGGVRPVVWLTQSNTGDDVDDSLLTWLDYEELDEEIDRARGIKTED